MTSLSPDHVSSTAHTFTSTKPSGSATSRIVSSVTSDAIPDDFFGHETQIEPFCLILFLYSSKYLTSFDRDFVKR